MESENTREWKRLERAHHNLIAGEYDCWYAMRRHEEAEFGPAAKKVEELFSRFRGGCFLDCGTGTGQVAVEAASGAGMVIAMDIAEKMIDIARKRAEEAGLSAKIHFVVGDAENLPFASEVFDCVTITGTLHHLPRFDTAIFESVRCLKAGGGIRIQEPTDIDRNPVDLLVKIVEKAGKIVLGRKASPVEKPSVGTPRERGLSPRALLRMVADAGVNYRVYFRTGYPFSRQIFGHRMGTRLAEGANRINGFLKRGRILLLLGIKSKP
ncbi:MAG TPA: class I SAM-dependent methyltransferase [bacterium]|nr:class I SAM-dependent methyltransferase [bacterium]